LLDLLKQHLPAQHAPFLHYRATSQDAIDTAHALALRAGLRELAQKVAAISGALRKLARELRHTPMLARTLLQPAQPSVWGVRVANWLAAFIGAAEELERAAGALPVQLGGPVGTLSELQGRGLQLSAALAEELDLRAPLLPWHSDRTPIAHALHATGLSVRAALKLANDLVLLAQNERSEVRMRAGGSSSMPHKQNPIDAIHAVAAGESCVRLCGTFVAGRTHELERAAGALQMEWLLLPLVFYTSGATLEALKTAVATLEITIVAAADSGIAQDDSAAALIDRVLEAATAQWGAEP
jgi:3-carboxy-cis,cis-muconate cycloisomerase